MDYRRRLFRRSNPPSSPWAKRFPIDDSTVIVKNTKHSLIAPQFPRINDPKNYDQDPDPNKNHRPQNYKDIDNVLWSEAFQRKVLRGARTFQLAALNRRLMFSTSTGSVAVAGGHRRSLVDRVFRSFSKLKVSGSSSSPPNPQKSPTALNEENEEGTEFQIYESERIQVDETKWFPFMQKKRWFDWIHFSPDDAQSKPDTTWSVDDPRIWSALSVSLELANRILRALIDDRQDGVSGIPSNATLRTILYGRIDHWSNFADVLGEPPYEKASVLLSHSMEQAIGDQRGSDFVPYVQTVTQTEEQLEARLNRLLERTVWGFQELDTALAVTDSQPEVSQGESPYTSIILIDVLLLEVILDSDVTLGELCQLQVNLAITIVHELMHAILFARDLNDNHEANISNKPKPDEYPDEPYLDGQGFNEAGYYMEHSFFGGVQRLAPEISGGYKAAQLMQYFHAWPDANEAFDFEAGGDRAFLEDGALSTIYHIPSTWSSRLLSDSFWKDAAFLRKSDNFFHNSRLFIVTAPIKNYKVIEYESPRLTNIQDQPGQPYNYPENKQIAEDWIHQTRLWETLRAPWYQRAFNEWEVSPWSYEVERNLTQSFISAFAKKDYIDCANIAGSLASSIEWETDHDTYLQYMPTKDDASGYWVFHAIGLLMMASIPIHWKKMSKREGKRSWMAELAPSKEAAADGRDMMVYTKPNLESPKEATARHISLYDQTKPDGGRIHGYTQLDCLKLIDSIIELIAKLDGIVHIRFLDAIEDAKKALLRDRKRLAASYPGRAHSMRWASKWPFEFPEYDPTIGSFENGRWRKTNIHFE
ncbi:hypothetical protein F4679DRAFT_587253 [Xylaria curta]|nr:hypothetical protein F4679DRAFT_587253 [Xylaria curta]